MWSSSGSSRTSKQAGLEQALVGLIPVWNKSKWTQLDNDMLGVLEFVWQDCGVKPDPPPPPTHCSYRLRQHNTGSSSAGHEEENLNLSHRHDKWAQEAAPRPGLKTQRFLWLWITAPRLVHAALLLSKWLIRMRKKYDTAAPDFLRPHLLTSRDTIRHTRLFHRGAMVKRVNSRSDGGETLESFLFRKHFETQRPMHGFHSPFARNNRAMTVLQPNVRMMGNTPCVVNWIYSAGFHEKC